MVSALAQKLKTRSFHSAKTWIKPSESPPFLITIQQAIYFVHRVAIETVEHYFLYYNKKNRIVYQEL